jgi:hypothetical protein
MQSIHVCGGDIRARAAFGLAPGPGPSEIARILTTAEVGGTARISPTAPNLLTSSCSDDPGGCFGPCEDHL